MQTQCIYYFFRDLRDCAATWDLDPDGLWVRNRKSDDVISFLAGSKPNSKRADNLCGETLAGYFSLKLSLLLYIVLEQALGLIPDPGLDPAGIFTEAGSVSKSDFAYGHI